MISRTLRILAMLAAITMPLSVFAAKEPIHINLATNDPAKVLMALDAGRQYAEKGYPIVIYLNDKAVFLGVVEVKGRATKVQEALQAAIANGAVVNICPSCLDAHGLLNRQLVQGVITGDPHRELH